MQSYKIAVLTYSIGKTHSSPSLVNYAPFKENCFMFCDNYEHKEIIEAKGWHFCYINCSDIDTITDHHACNLKGKQIKFLQVLKIPEYEFLKNNDFIFCVDHKIKIWAETVEYIVNHSVSDPVNLTTMGITSIDGEFVASMQQTRYKVQELEYKNVIQHYMNKGCQYDSFRPINGIICYNLMSFKNEVFSYTDDVYSSLINFNVIQDQIVTFFINQQHKINYIGYNQSCPLRLLTLNELITRYDQRENIMMPMLIG